MADKKIQIYTDGSCIGNPGPGGWAAIIVFDKKEKKLFGGEKAATNNRMELKSVIAALTWLKTESGIDEKDLNNYEIIIYSDSNLLVQTLVQGWKRKANIELWTEIDRLREWLNIKWEWVKAHHINKYNNMADNLAFNEAQKQKISHF